MKREYLNIKTFLFIVFIFILFLIAAFNVNINIYIVTLALYVLFVAKNGFHILILDKYFSFYTAFIIYLILLGVFNNNFKSYLYFDVLSFMSFLFIAVTVQQNRTNFFTTELPKIGFYINVLAIIFCIIHLFTQGFNIASMESGRGLDELVEGQIMSPKYYFYGSLFLYPLRNYIVVKKQIFIYDVSIILFIFFSLAMASRGTTIIGFLIFVLTYFQRNKIRLKLSTIFNKVFFKYILFILILFLLLYQIPKISSAVEYLIYRFTSEESLGESRTEEAWIIYNALSFNELIFGRGLGASNTYWIFSNVEHGVNNVHYGWMFLILKGGILFVMLIYFKIIWCILKLQKSKLLAPYAITLLAFLLLEYAHTNFNSVYHLSFMFIALSATSLVNKK